ncbi:right-handed parallel beta-helix repeat-containing protein [Patescibacteria group bacterium]
MRFWGVLVFIIILLVIAIPIFLYGAFGKPWLKMNWRSEVRDDSVSGILLRSQTWGGEVSVSGDVFVAWWAKITIEPGTTVRIAITDDQKTGQDPGAEPEKVVAADPTSTSDYSRDRIEMRGTIMAKGTAAEPITFIPVEPDTEYGAWQGMTLREGSSLQHVSLSNVQVGLRSAAKITLENVEVSNCLWDCLRLTNGEAHVSDSSFTLAWNRAAIISGSAKPFLQHNTFSRSAIGMELRNNAAPIVLNNTFSDNVVAVYLETAGPAEFRNNTLQSPGGPGVAGGTFKGAVVYPNEWQTGRGDEIEGTNLLEGF